MVTLSDEERKNILGIFRRTQNLRRTARAAGRSEALVLRVLEEAGVEYLSKRKAYEAKLAQVPATFAAMGGCITQVASFLGINAKEAKRALDEAGIPWRKTRKQANATMRAAIEGHAIERGLE